MANNAGRVLEKLGRDAHAAGDYRLAAERYERAFAAYRLTDDRLAAARAARTVGWFHGWVFGDWAVHRGWIARSRRVLEADDQEPARGWVLLDDALRGDDFDTQRRQYSDVLAIARACGDRDLECDATASLGMMLVFTGWVDEGMACLDEALAAICGGDVEELPVVEGCLCGLLTACERTHDLARADEWLRASKAVMQRQNLVSVAGYCRSRYAGILIAVGRWSDAEDELNAALDQLPDEIGVSASARCRLAGLRVQQGRLGDARRLLVNLEGHDDAVLPTAALLLADAQPQPAIELLERALRNSYADYIEAPMLAMLVDADLAAGDHSAARSAANRLEVVARRQSATYLHALSAATRAQCDSAEGSLTSAREFLHDAISSFQRAGRAVDAARARLELGRLIAADRPHAAQAELDAAYAVFESAGARRLADEAAALLRSLGGGAKTGPKTGAILTRREEEVIEMLTDGLTNAEIGERLFISPKTVEHHVGRILTKLGVRSRAEAAAMAVRRAHHIL